MIRSYKTSSLSIPLRSLGFIVLVIGLVLSLSEDLLGMAFLVLGVLLIQAHFGISINSEEKTLREYLNVMGFKSGHWLNINRAAILQLIATEESQRMWVGSIHRINYSKIYKLYLSEGHTHKLLGSGGRDKMLTLGKKLKNELDITFIDKT